MGISSTTVGIVSTAVVLLLTGFCYYFFFYEEETSTHVQSTSPTDTTLKKILPKKKNAHGSKIFALTKGFNAKTALSHATDHKEHPLYWRELGGHVMAASCVAFSHPQHDLVASGSVDGTVRCAVISQLGTPHPLEVYTKLDGPPDAMSFTQNAKRLVIASLGNIYFYSIVVTPKTRKIELVKHFPCSLIQVHALQLLDVEQWMVVIVAGLSSSDNSPSIQAFNPKGTLINDFQQVKRQGRADKLRPPNATKSLAVSSPDDRFVALCGCGEAPPRTLGDGEVGVFEVERDAAGHTKRLKLSFVLAGHSSEVLCMAWNATGMVSSVCLLGTCLIITYERLSCVCVPVVDQESAL